MSTGLNRVTLLGNLGADPELRYTSKDKIAVLKLRLATNESWLDKSGQKQERTEWHDVTVWGNRAEALAKLLKKGECILVEGRLQTSSYDKDGVKRWRTEIVASDVCLTGGKRTGLVAPERDDTPSPPLPPPGGRNGAKPTAVLHDEIPF